MWITTPIFKEDMDYILNSTCIDWDRLKDSTVLITGGTGLIGSTIISSLVYANVKKNYNIKILALVRNLDKANDQFREQFGCNAGLEFILGNIEEKVTLPTRIDYIIHCASPTASAFFVNNPVETMKTAILGTLNMLELAKANQVSGMIYLSSMEAYGKITTQELLREDQLGYIDLLNVRNSYPESKRICEAMCCAYSVEYNIPAYSIRLAQTFGPGVAYDDKRVFAMMARNAMNTEDIILQTKGSSRHSYLYTAQAVTAILTILLRGNPGEIYNAANPETYCSIYEMGEMVAQELANRKIQIKVAENGDVSKYPDVSYLNLDISKLKALGWYPEHSLAWIYKRMMETMR